MARSPLFDGVSPALLNAIKRVGDSYGPYGVRITSAYRPGSGHSQHGRGKAIDVELYDKKTGKAVPNYQNAESAATYQQFANAVYQDAQKNDPALAAKLRWGGYFGNDPATGKPKYGSLDLMHFDEAGHVGMRGGSWKEGFSPEMQKYWKIAAQGAAGAPAATAGTIYPSTAGPEGPVGPAPAAPLSSREDPRGMAAHIRATAKRYNIDPEVALRVAKSEGLTSFQSSVVKDGVREPSWGAFQLYTGGGLGNEFQRQTGLDPADPKNEQATIDYALKHASQHGWGSWYGAKNTGISRWEGVNAGSRDVASGYGGIGSDAAASARAAEAATAVASAPSGAGGIGSDSAHVPDQPYETNPSAVASTLGRKIGDSAGDAFSDLGKIFAGAAARNAAQPSGPTTIAPAQLPMPPGVQPIVDPRQAEAHRQQLAQAMARLNSGKLV